MFRANLRHHRSLLGAFRQSRYFSAASKPRTMYDKLWDSHLVYQEPGSDMGIIYIDRHLVHEVTSPQAFEGLAVMGRKIRRLDCTLAVVDHNVPTTDRSKPVEEPDSKLQIDTLDQNVKAFGLEYFDLHDVRQGIVHIVGPEQGFTQPGMTVVCGDSHTATHGAFGALAFGIGTSEIEHVFATQTLQLNKAKNMRIAVEGKLPVGVTSKDMILKIISIIGTAGGTGHVIEYTGEAIQGLSMEARMTICNMSIEAGARAGLIAPDNTTYRYLKGRPKAPKAEHWDQAVLYWNSLVSDPGSKYDKEVVVPVDTIDPQLTWGTSPEHVVSITGKVPSPDEEPDPVRKAALQRALEYMDLKPGQNMQDIKIDKVFVGSCTNARIEDIRAVAEVAKGRKVKQGIHAMVVPGSGLVKRMAEQEGLAVILKEAGFDWREPGCSMCLGMNPDQLSPGERCASTSNRNFEGRQGRGGRTHLVSPGMAAAAAIEGCLTDVRKFARKFSTGSRRCAPGCNCHAKRAFSTKEEPNPLQFTRITGTAIPMPMPNVDTDMIVPKQFLKTIKRTGLGKAAFYYIRYNDDGSEKQDFVLNQTKYRNGQILIAGENFGCGSSREHAPWALLDFGIRVILAPSYADIFFNNCFKNGMLPLIIPEEQLTAIMEHAKGSNPEVSVDLQTRTIKYGNKQISFDVADFRRECLLNGWDEIALTLKHEDKITAFEKKRKVETPWL